MTNKILESEKTLCSGKITEIYPGLRRLLAPNPGPFTGPGTNTYILGNEKIVIIDPGPANHDHINIIVEEFGSCIQWVLCTHTHLDHSPAAELLADKLSHSVNILGLPAPEGMGQDATFNPGKFAHGDLLQTDDFTLEAIHTPGHASNHLCFLYREEGILFTGDHIMQGSSVIISPPDGDMKAYMESLQNLRNYSLRWLAPAHGHMMDTPLDVINFTLKHRLDREEKVHEALKEVQRATLDELLPMVYDDVPVFMHPAARQSLWAHLLKFQQDGVAIEKDDHWLIVADSS